jgi:DNA-binding GntR family transcriptional regulator
MERPVTASIRLDPVEAQDGLREHLPRRLKAAIGELDIYHPDAELRLDERGLAERLGISRTPVREALFRLEQEGFVETRPRRGVFVRRHSCEEILEMITVWAALESMAARLACLHATDAEIAGLREIAAHYTRDEARANISEYSEANIAFHRTVLALSRCARLVATAEGLFEHLKPVRRRALADRARAGRSVVDHMDIIRAIEAREAERAETLVREHTFRLHAYIRRSWRALTAGAALAEAG